ncbi:MAG: Ig-like domain-containing protein [Clostridia bacterium]|nr:Ig-like domain-containing protein [Clostridia bacterium]
MKTFISKIAIFIIAIILSFSLIACNSNNGGNNNNGGSNNPSQEQPGDEGPNVSQVQPEEPVITMLESKNMVLGESFILSPNKKNIYGEFSWHSSNPSVATVNGGVVKAIAVGETDIIASIGETFAKCKITVTYGDFKPELILYSGIDKDGVTISTNTSFTILPYVLYNLTEYTDAEYKYTSDNESVVAVSKDGVVTGIANGQANVTIEANWRDFMASEEGLLTKTISITVKDNVEFMLNGGVAGGFSIQTPASYIPESEHNNVVKFTPTVSVNNNAPVVVENVTLTPVGGIVEGVDYTFEKVGNEYVYTALALGDSLVTLEYQVGEDVHSTNFYITATRPTIAVAETVKYFNIKEGTIKDEVGGKMVTSTLLKKFWGEGVTLYDAYCNAKPLAFTEDGAILNVEVTAQNAVGHSVLVLGTKTEILEIPVDTAGYFMFDKEDVYNALVASPYSADTVSMGYFPVMNDIDMEGTAVNAYMIKEFNGLFDGRGNVISNLVSDTTSYTVNGETVRGGGLFGFLRGSIRNVAFVNLKGIQNSSHSYVGLLGEEFHVGTIENVYLDINPETLPFGIGLFYNIGSAGIVTIKNTVINYPAPEDYKWDDSEYANWCEAGGYCAGRGVLGGGLTSYSLSGNMYTVKSNINAVNLMIVSPMPLYHGAPARVPEGYETKVDSTDYFVYAENETKLWYQHSMLNEFYYNHKGEHTVASAGEIAGKQYQFRTNQKVRVLPGIRRYDTMQDLVADTSELMLGRMEELYDPDYFISVDNAPVWNSLVDNKTVITANGVKLEKGVINIDCYQEAEIDIQALTEKAVSVQLYENSDLISINGTKLVADKVGEGATLTITYVWGNRTYTKLLTVNVLNPFKIFVDGNAISDSYEKILGETANLEIKIGDAVVENVTFSENADGLSISGGVLSIDKVVENAVIKANFEYRGTQYELSFTFNTIDPVSVATIVTANGSDCDGVVNAKISNETLVALKLDGKVATISSISITSDKFEVNGDKVTAVGYGEAEMIIIFTVDGVSHKKVIKVATAYDTTTVASSVDYDANEGVIKSYYQGTVLEAKIVYNNTEIHLTEANGGVVDGLLYSVTSKEDAKVGVPYINAKSAVKNMAINLYTTYGVYAFANVDYATVVIETAKEFEDTIDYGDYNFLGVANGTYEYKLHDGIYVLANDIDLTGIVIENRVDYVAQSGAAYKISSANVGFAGIFDGRGYTISNATINTSALSTAVNEETHPGMGTGWRMSRSYGIFHNVQKGAIIKDVAFINIFATNSQRPDTNSITGVFSRDFNGTLENVYIDINPSTTLMKGVAYSLSANAVFNNVVINFPKADGFEFDYTAATTDTAEKSNYTYGYGSLAGTITKTVSFNNVYVIAKFPLQHSADANKDTTDGTDGFVYGENETSYWFNHTANEGKPFSEVVVNITASTDASLAKMISSVRRYASVSALTSDTDEKNVAMLNALKSTELFKVLDGQLLWHTQKLTYVVNSAVNYEAATGILSVSDLPANVNKVIVNGEELNLDNGGLIKDGDSYKLRAKTSATDTLPGIPYILDGESQELQLVIDAGDKVYNYNKVIYWSDILTTANDVDKYFNLGVYNAETNAYVSNDRFLALGNDVDMLDMGADYVIANNYRVDNSGSWVAAYEFNGVFDGQGNTIKNASVSAASLDRGYNHAYGFFGMVYGATVKNVAFTNFKSVLKSGEQRTQYGGSVFYEVGRNSVVENIYIDISADSYEDMPVIYSVAWSKATLKNIVVKENYANYVWNEDKYAQVSVGGYKQSYGVFLGDSKNYNSASGNVYVISPRPLVYGIPSTKPTAGTAHGANGWSDNDSLTTDYFIYGANETKLWFSHTILDTLDPDNIGKHTVQTVNANNATGKARINPYIRRYDNADAVKADTSTENANALQALVDTGFFTVSNGVIAWA